MAPTPKKNSNPAYPAEASLIELRRCLVNLPAPLVNVLVDAKILVQNVVIEISWRTADKKDGKPTSRSIYVGWTGMQSKHRSEALVTQNGRQVRQPELLEIDSAFASLLGLQDKTRVGILLHSDVPQSHTISIDPLTPADWEIIEMHPEFLETNFLSQVRALPNPGYKSSAGVSTAHPLSLHLSATSTANVLVTSLKPPPPLSAPFAKIAGENAEVIVAPKSRQKLSVPDDDDMSADSVTGRSGSTALRSKGGRADGASRPTVFLRGVDREIVNEWFDIAQDDDKNLGLKVWVDSSILTSKELRGFNYVWASILRPTALQSVDEDNADTVEPATRLVVRILPWADAPNAQHVALSSELCTAFGDSNTTGAMIRLEPAPPQVSKSAIRALRIHPFAEHSDRQKDGLRFGGKTKADNLEAAQTLIAAYSGEDQGPRMLDGPITDGMILPPCEAESEQERPSWPGGIVKFLPASGSALDTAKTSRGWLLGSDRRLVATPFGDATKSSGNDRKLAIEVANDTVKYQPAPHKWQNGDSLPTTKPVLVGIDPVIEQIASHLRHASSTLLTGSHGAGKSSLAQFLAHTMREEQMTHVIHFSCQSLVTDETRVSAVKDTLDRVFSMARWGAQLGGTSLVVLDDLDVLCPSETELEVGNDNARSRHISEVVMTLVRQHCSIHSRVVLLATAQSKESLHNIIISGHVVQEIVHLAAPDKESRRKVLQSAVHEARAAGKPTEADYDMVSGIDFLEVAGRTDGFMPGDILLLVSRAQSESLIRTLSSSYSPNGFAPTQADFDSALKDFTPTSLRNVTLQHSSTTFSSIGGLRATRQTLMETLQYPTLYAPIFAKCPLRLRSGLLLYGYPGCGKTLLASAVAGECGLNFISVKGPEILNKYIGASEKSVRDLFERAQAARPCVLFFDEFDSVAPKRGHDSTGVTDRVVNQLLTQMDGAEGLSGVYVLAATSRPDLIDPALLRPGRLDKSLMCNMPDHQDRRDIVDALSGRLRLGQSAKLQVDELARRTDGFTGADLQAVIYNAQLEAIHDALGGKAADYRPSQTTADGATRSQAHGLDFSHFRIGDESDKEPDSNAALARRAAERSQILRSLTVHRAAQQRSRKLRRESIATTNSHGLLEDERDDDSDSDDSDDAAAAEREPVIEWVHFERALDQTRPSISEEEVRRLDQIYREFVASRNGEMPNGQGGSEIGARTSLM